MTTQDFNTTILVDQSPKEVFNAINNVRGWWSENITGRTDELNSEFTYQAKELHKCKMKINELVPNEKVVWLVLENYFSFTKDQSEWIGTKVEFDISEVGGRTQVHFTHRGLVPAHECYTICHDAWSGYINNSLRSLITTGKGQPNPKEEVNA
ncbi:MAG TPA: SRPBCC domain-containing protein [Arachidicoccus sp.]|nr:SRPBCC domain-containing protein [Arachidicoccus sp.]